MTSLQSLNESISSSSSFDWNLIPSYGEFFTESYHFFIDNINSFKHYNFPYDFFSDLKQCIDRFTLTDFSLIIIMTIVWTLTRKYATKYFFQPMGDYFNIPQSDHSKMPESAWKLTFYSGTWTYMVYLLFANSDHNYFHEPTLVWRDYSMDSVIPIELYSLYIIQISFYVHSLYSTAFIDLWRKDSLALLIHHIICVILMLIALTTKTYKSGILALFFHDGCDILLEGTKLTRYFRNQKGRIIKWMEIFTNIGFACFTISWFVSRLYLFPLKQIWITSVYVKVKHIPVPFILITNTLLWGLFIMNIYWFSFIIKLLYKVGTGQVKELEDNREYNQEKSKDNTSGSECTQLPQTKGSNNTHYYLRKRRNSLNFKDIVSGRSQ